MHRTLLRRAERYSSPGTLGTGFRIPITNCSYSGLCRPLAWTAFSVTSAIHPACRQSNSPESRSVRLPSNMAPNSDNHPRIANLPVMRFPSLLAAVKVARHMYENPTSQPLETTRDKFSFWIKGKQFQEGLHRPV